MILSREEEKNLVGNCLSGEKSAWDAFVDQYSKLIYSVVYKTFQMYAYEIQTDLAEDLHQEVFLSLLKGDFSKLKRFSWKSNCSLATWLRIVTRNIVIDHIRKQARERAKVVSEHVQPGPEYGEEAHPSLFNTLPDTGPSPDSELLSQELIKLLKENIRGLPEQDRKLLELIYYEEWAPDDVARLLGKSVDAIYMQKKRIVDKLKVLAKKEC